MKRTLAWGIIAALGLSLAGTLRAEDTVSGARHLDLQRDSTYEQFLRYEASADTAITPARVLRWINSLMGHSTQKSVSNFEIQPIVRARDNREQVILQFAYKF